MFEQTFAVREPEMSKHVIIPVMDDFGVCGHDRGHLSVIVCPVCEAISKIFP